MKIKPEHYAHMRAEMFKVMAANPDKGLAHYQRNNIGKDPVKRFRWDVLWAAKLSIWVCDTLYPYGINDDHIDTALRNIIQEYYRNVDRV